MKVWLFDSVLLSLHMVVCFVPVLLWCSPLMCLNSLLIKSICEADPAVRRGDSVHLVGLSRSLQATSRKSIVTNPCAAVNIASADSPRYRATNMEVIELDTGTWSYHCLYHFFISSSLIISTILPSILFRFWQYILWSPN